MVMMVVVIRLGRQQLLFALAVTGLWLQCCHGQSDWHTGPIIGVLAEEYGGEPWDGVPFIAASYVKFVELGGARVVPVHINRDQRYYTTLLDQLNGVLFPGGDADLHDSGYGRAGKVIFDYAVERNRRGDFFPLWGTCNGFEMLVYLSVDTSAVLTRCNSTNQAVPLDFRNASDSRLFGSMPADVESYLSTKNTTVNFHEWCLTPDSFTKFGVSRLYRAMSVNRDWNGLEYISSIEAKHYPFYGVQFHPEKNAFEWSNQASYKSIPHSAEAIRVTQYFAEFLVNEARKSKHKMSDQFFNAESIYNYQPTFTQEKSYSTQIYFFGNRTRAIAVR